MGLGRKYKSRVCYDKIKICLGTHHHGDSMSTCQELSLTYSKEVEAVHVQHPHVTNNSRKQIGPLVGTGRHKQSAVTSTFNSNPAGWNDQFNLYRYFHLQ